MTIALFDAYPRLAELMPRVALCQLPTPVQRLHSFPEANAYVKRDDISAPEFGGNKVRALEFLLGSAVQQHVPRAITMGLAGTSMAVASAIYGKQHHPNLAVLLISQHTTEEAQRNLLIFQKLGTELHTAASVPGIALNLLRLMLGGLFKYGKLPYFLNPGSLTGMTGYTNMAFELRDQIRAGQLPEPDRIYIAMGLRGTATGLLLGLRAAGLKSRLVAVASHDSQAVLKLKANMIKSAQKLNAFLRQRAPDFPIVAIGADDFDVECDAPQQEMNTLVNEGFAQRDEVEQKEGLRLDATWTAPVWAAMQRDLKAGRTNQPLFWHTYNSQPSPVNLDGVDYHKLPKAFHHYFEDPVTLINKPFFKKD